VAASDFGYIDLFVRFDASVDVSRLRQSLDTVLRRHSALRTRFPDAQTQLVERTPVSVDVVDGHTGSALRRELRERAQYRYDFVREVPLQLLLARETSGSVLLHLHVHHILFDGTSSSVFFRDLAAVYEQRSLAPPSFQYVDFAVWQAAYVQSSSFRETRQYWQARFAGASGPLLIASEFANNSCDVTGDRECLELRGDWVQRIRAAARLHDATPFTLFTAAYLRLLGEITGQRDVVIGTTAAGRPVHDAAENVGVFVNPLPVRFCLDAHDDDDALIAEVRRRLVEFHEHQAYWVEDLVTHVDPFIGAKLNDVFSTYILLQNYWRPRPLIGTVRYAPVHVEGVVEHRLMRDVELVINESTNGWTLELWYRRANHSRESATTWLRRFEELATDLVDTRRKVSR
jgi:surfactin family lipopeptide synthetase A/lichenysin synthetase A